MDIYKYVSTEKCKVETQMMIFIIPYVIILRVANIRWVGRYPQDKSPVPHTADTQFP